MSRGRSTTASVGALAAALVAGWGVLPGGQGEAVAAVAAVRDSPPERIGHELMSTVPGGPCGWGEARTYAAQLPQLRVEARDPDNVPQVADKVMVQLRVAWQDGAGAERSYTWPTAGSAEVTPQTGKARRAGKLPVSVVGPSDGQDR
ncbi:hypothetical protein [Streptomyces sp. NPDC006645]|uniref:hypothetical protein n=1 Tax=Streptomyces sp. NPDC006645 TaxID=3157184 RepID=UPI0033AE5A08